ncbi:Hypothetical protein CpATCC19410_1938 [Corynebacterium pseudotuberculosis]|nr:Hypothetical protein CpATCC19410_1938 [Corynebacterium pseudotuberculosis]
MGTSYIGCSLLGGMVGSWNHVKEGELHIGNIIKLWEHHNP